MHAPPAVRAGLLAALAPLWLALSTPAGAETDPSALPSPLPLAWCLERANRHNPALAVSLAHRDAARERIVPAGALDDPRLGYEASNVPLGDFDFRSTPLSGHQLGLRQRLPFPGLLSQREEAARAGARAAAAGVDEQRLRVAGAVETAWAELGFAQRALALTERNVALLRQLAEVAETKYRVGGGLQQDVLRAQVELTVLLEEALRREAAVESAGAGLAALLDLPPATRFPPTEPLTARETAPPLEPLLASATERSPRLRAMAERVEEARRRVRAAELEGYPDFDLGLGYRIRRDVRGDPVNGDDFLSAGVTVRLPLHRGKWRARAAEARAELRRAEAEERRTRAELGAELRRAHAALSRAASEEELLASGLVPQAEHSLDASRSGYEVGRVDFLSVLDSQVRLLQAELRLLRAQADRRQAYAALEAAAGETLR